MRDRSGSKQSRGLDSATSNPISTRLNAASVRQSPPWRSTDTAHHRAVGQESASTVPRLMQARSNSSQASLGFRGDSSLVMSAGERASRRRCE